MSAAKTSASNTGLAAGLLNLRYTPLYFLALLFLVAGHYYQLNDVGGYALFLPFNSTSWMVVILLIGVTLIHIGYRRELVFSHTTLLLLVSCGLLTLPLFYPSALAGPALLRISGLWAGFLLFVTLQQYQLSRENLLSILKIITLGVALELARYWYSMATGYLSTGRFPDTQGYPLFGIFQQRNVMSSFVASGMVLSAYLLAGIETKKYDRYYILPLLFLIPLLSIQVLYAMASRTGWYGAIVGLLLLIPFLSRNCRTAYIVTWVSMASMGFIISIAMQNFGGWSVPEKAIFSLAGARSIIFPQAISMLFNNLLFGVGLGGFESHYIAFTAEAYSNGSIANPSLPNTFHPHNEILYWGVEGGIVALSGLLVAAWSLARLIWRLDWNAGLAMVAVFFPIVLHSQVEAPFYASVLHFVIFVVLIHHVDATVDIRESRSLGALHMPLKISGLILPLFAVLLLTMNLHIGYTMARFNAGYTTLNTVMSLGYSPVWSDRINYAISSNRLLYGIANKDEESIRQFIDWIPELKERQPRPQFYEQLIMAHQALNEFEAADRVIEEFRYLFPGTELLTINQRN